jgi:hypothetical protein
MKLTNKDYISMILPELHKKALTTSELYFLTEYRLKRKLSKDEKHRYRAAIENLNKDKYVVNLTPTPKGRTKPSKSVWTLAKQK